jgi:signal recognition particle subunit SRP54
MSDGSHSRRVRIARGSGSNQNEVRALITQFEQMQGMMTQFGRMAKKGKVPAGMAGMDPSALGDMGNIDPSMLGNGMGMPGTPGMPGMPGRRRGISQQNRPKKKRR